MNTSIGTGTGTGTGANSGSTALNSGSDSVFGPDSPTSTTSNSVTLAANRIIVLFIFTFIYLSRN
jgi:hypothetical protein